LRESGKPRSHAIEDDLNRCAHITSLYTEAVLLLIQRLTALYVDHDIGRTKIAEVPKLPFLSKFTSQIPVGEGERDLNGSILSVRIVSDRIENIADFVEDRKEALLPKYVATAVTELSRQDRQCFVRDWAGLDKMCRLLMEEIAYVRGRNDEFKRLFATYRTIKNAIVVAICTLAISFTSLLATLVGNIASAVRTASPNGSAKQTDAAMAAIVALKDKLQIP
jgi:hypothetical protein